MIPVTEEVSIDERDLEVRFIRSPGPGGQNVNKVETGVQLRFDTGGLAVAVRERLRRLAGRRMTRDGVVVITATTHRTQERNRAAALERLTKLIAAAAKAPKKRRPTRPGKAAKARRLDAKRKRGAVKEARGRVRTDD